jgi:hypothetical protein
MGGSADRDLELLPPLGRHSSSFCFRRLTDRRREDRTALPPTPAACSRVQLRAANKCLVSLTNRIGNLRKCTLAYRRYGHAQSEDSVSEAGDDVVVRESVDGVDEMRLLAERIRAARSDADFERELDRADGGRPAGCVEVACHRSRQQHGGRADEWGVDDLEVVVLEREGRLRGSGQRSKPQPLSAGCGSFAGGSSPLLLVSADIGHRCRVGASAPTMGGTPSPEQCPASSAA